MVTILRSDRRIADTVCGDSVAVSLVPHWAQNTAPPGAVVPHDSHARMTTTFSLPKRADYPFHFGIDSPTLRSGALASVSRRLVQKKDTG
jgi:hypothetical protein